MVSGEDVEAGVVQVLPEAGSVRVSRELPPGRNHRSWKVESDIGPLVAKVLVGRGDLGAYVWRARLHRTVSSHGTPVPALLAFNEAVEGVGRRALTVLRYVEGRDAAVAMVGAPADATRRAIGEAAKGLARLHDVGVNAFTGPHDACVAAGGEATWSDVVHKRLSRLRARYVAADIEPTTDHSAAFKLVSMLAEEVSPVARPSVVHLDVHLPNIVVDDALRFVALIDLEHLAVADAAMDLVKPGLWMLPRNPDWREAFEDGYAAAAGQRPRWDERLCLATGLELLTGIEYWTRAGDSALLADYTEALTRWVRSQGEEHAISWATPERRR